MLHFRWRRALLLLACGWSPLALAGVLNVEFKFTPYTGDLKEDHVQTVAGTARVYLNNGLVAEQEVRKDSVPVIFDDREIAPSVWVPADSMGPALRKGHNRLRIEFQPTDPKSAYHGQLSWAQVTDQVQESEGEDGSHSSTNQAGEGKEDRPATGKLVMEREFDADFATDRPWHHYPALAALSDADKAQLSELVKARGAGFKPDFKPLYDSLAAHPEMQVGEIRKSKCVDAAYAAGVRVSSVPSAQLEYELSGGPEVLVHGRGAALYDFGDKSVFGKIKGEDQQMCAGIVLSVAYPQRMAFVRDPSGHWQQVY